LAFATVWSGFFSSGRYLRFRVRASCLLAQLLASSRFCSEKPRLTLASDLGRGNFLALTDPSGFVVENHSTPWASGSSAALGPLVGDLVSLDSLVARAPPDLDLHVRLLGA